MEIYSGNVFGGRLVVFDNGDYIFMEGDPEASDTISTYYRVNTGPERLRIHANHVYETYTSRGTTSRLRRIVEENSARLDSLRSRLRPSSTESLYPGSEGAASATMRLPSSAGRVSRPRDHVLSTSETLIPESPRIPLGARFATTAHDIRDYVELRELQGQIRERQALAGIVLELGYHGRLGLKNVPAENFRQIQNQISRISRESSAAPAGIEYIELQNFQYYVWNGRSYVRNSDIEEFQQNLRELEALATLLEWYGSLIIIGIQIAGLAIGVSAYIQVGRTLASALGLTAGEVVTSEIAMRTVISPLIQANVDDPATELVLNLVFGFAVGFIAAHSMSRLGSSRVAAPRLGTVSSGALTGEVIPTYEVPFDAIDAAPRIPATRRLPSGGSIEIPTSVIGDSPSTRRALPGRSRSFPSTTSIEHDISRGTTSESRGLTSTTPETTPVPEVPPSTADEFAGTFDETLSPPGLTPELPSIPSTGSAVSIREFFGSENLRNLLAGFRLFDDQLPQAINRIRSRFLTGSRRSATESTLDELRLELTHLMNEYPMGTALTTELRAEAQAILNRARRLARTRWNEVRPRLWQDLYSDAQLTPIFRMLEDDGLIRLPRNFPNTSSAPSVIGYSRNRIIWNRLRFGESIEAVSDSMNVSRALVRRISRLEEAPTGQTLLPINLDHITPIQLNPFRFFDPNNLRVLNASYNDTWLRIYQVSSSFPMTDDVLEAWIRSNSLN